MVPVLPADVVRCRIEFDAGLRPELVAWPARDNDSRLRGRPSGAGFALRARIAGGHERGVRRYVQRNQASDTLRSGRVFHHRRDCPALIRPQPYSPHPPAAFVRVVESGTALAAGMRPCRRCGAQV